MGKYETLHQLTKICKASRTRLEELIKYEEIDPSFIKGKAKYYLVDLIVDLADKYRTIKSIVDGFNIDMDYRTIVKELRLRNMEPNFTKSRIEYYDVKEVFPIVKEIKDRQENPHLQKVQPLYRIAERLGTQQQVLERLVEYQKILPERETSKGRYYNVEEVQYAYEKLLYARRNFKTVSKIANEYNINRDILHDAVKMFNVEPKYIHDYRYYEEKEVLQAFNRRREKIEENQKKQKNLQSFYDKLHPKLRQLVDKYIEIRKNELVIFYGNFKTGKEISHPERNLPRMKNNICSALFKIAVYRLENENKKVVLPVFFDVTTINMNDYIPIRNALKNSSLMGIAAAIKPFLMSLLAEAKEEALKSRDYSAILASHAFELGVEKFLVQFPRFPKEGNSQKHPKQIIKSFLSREECIKVYELLLTDPRSKYPIRNATMWVLGTVLGVRPQEFMYLRIEYFILNDEGFLAVDANGWGKLDIPAEASKMGLSPSNVFYQTPVPPEAVRIINNYLRWLYDKQGKQNPRGVGYFFRKLIQFPEKGLTTHVNEYIKRIRNLLDFLNIEQQEDFELKASRRTMNNLFVTSNNVLPEKLRGRVVEISRAYHMRHKIAVDSQENRNQERKNYLQGEVGEYYYTAPISKDEFYSVLECVVGFPWDSKKLVLWEIEKGYRDGIDDIEIEFDDEVEEKEFITRIRLKKEEKYQEEEKVIEEKLDKNDNLQKKLNIIEVRLGEMRNPPNSDIDFDKWRKEIVKLRKEKEKIETYLNNR